MALFGHICATAPAIDGQLLTFIEGVTSREIEMFIGVAAKDLHFGLGLQRLDVPYDRNGNPFRAPGKLDSNTVGQFHLQCRSAVEGD